VINFATASGSGIITSSTAFFNPTVTLTLTAGQRVMLVQSNAFGASANAANALNMYPCYQISGGPITTVGGGIFGLTADILQRNSYSINGIFTVPASGTYTIGACGSSLNAANWTNNEWGYVSVIVFN